MRIINQILQKPREIFGFPKFITSGAGLSNTSKAENDMNMHSRLEESKQANSNAKKYSTTKMADANRTEILKEASYVSEEGDNCLMSTPAEIHLSLEEKEDTKMGSPILQRIKSHSISSCSTATPRPTFSGEPESMTLDRRKTKKTILSKNYNKFSL